MPGNYTLGKHFEAFVQAQVSSGCYTNASEVLRDALRLMEDRERRLAFLDASLESGLVDFKTGQVYGLDQVCDELHAELQALADQAGK